MTFWRSWLLAHRLGRRRAVVQPPASTLCRRLAIIMDGNGRWAKQHRLPVAAGHRSGAKALRRVLEHALTRGIEEVTVYSFSTENWRRPAAEIEALMDLFIEMIDSEIPDLHARGVRVRFIGGSSGVPERLTKRIVESETLTAGNDRLTLYIAFNYGGRQEIVDAAAAVAAAGEQFTADNLGAHLYAPQMNEPELVIRTSGELRLSNFLLWQSAYSELYFCDTYWPDFDEAELDKALADYANRQRRFGGREQATT